MTGKPLFSVIIPTHNRLRLLAACVQSVLAQTMPPDSYEVIVVDDGSRTAATSLLKPYRDRVRVLRQRQHGWAAARRLGVEHSRSDIVVFIDDDCAAPPGWLRCYEQAYKAHADADGVAGGLRPGLHMNVAGAKQYLGHLAYFNTLNRDLGIDAQKAGRAWFSFGGNRSFRRQVWLAVQPDEPVWYFDDYLIDLALRERGARVFYEPDAWVSHHYVLSLQQRVLAAYRYGRSCQLAQRPGPTVDSLPALTLVEMWRRLGIEAPGSPLRDRLWYAATQPLVWAARWAGGLPARSAD